MKRTVDASVAVKWFVSEADDALAERLLGVGVDLYAPDLIFSEVTNTFWRKLRQAEATEAQFERACQRLRSYLAEVTPSAHLMARAGELAAAMGHPAYDCFYIACAERHDAPLVTADKRLLRASHKAGLARHVIPLHA